MNRSAQLGAGAKSLGSDELPRSSGVLSQTDLLLFASNLNSVAGLSNLIAGAARRTCLGSQGGSADRGVRGRCLRALPKPGCALDSRGGDPRQIGKGAQGPRTNATGVKTSISICEQRQEVNL